MAHWTDGPEYAPTERPDVFVEPDAEPLDDPSTSSGAGVAEPVEAQTAPSYTAPDAPALDALVPAPASERDPREAFDVVSTPMTSWSSGPLEAPEGEPVPLAPPPGAGLVPTPSAWGHAHAPHVAGRPMEARPPWAPEQPLPPGHPAAPTNIPGPPPAWPPAQVNPDGFPQPGPPPWQQPGPQRPFEPVTFAAMLRGATPGVLITLGLGVLVPMLSLALLMLGSALATRVRYRRRLVGRLFSGAILASLALGALGMVVDRGTFDVFGWYDASTSAAHLACLVLLVATPLVVGDAMRRGEEPEGYL